jgi:hypothetical protein
LCGSIRGGRSVAPLDRSRHGGRFVGAVTRPAFGNGLAEHRGEGFGQAARRRLNGAALARKVGKIERRAEDDPDRHARPTGQQALVRPHAVRVEQGDRNDRHARPERDHQRAGVERLKGRLLVAAALGKDDHGLARLEQLFRAAQGGPVGAVALHRKHVPQPAHQAEHGDLQQLFLGHVPGARGRATATDGGSASETWFGQISTPPVRGTCCRPCHAHAAGQHEQHGAQE